MAAHDRPIIIKKVKKGGGGGHHGGAWKVAYADFVTAMMAFFLLMWLINATNPEQLQGIADYFAPASISSTTSGAGGILAGTTLGQQGTMGSGATSIQSDIAPQGVPGVDLSASTDQELRDELERRDEAAFASAAQSIRQALQDRPELAEISKQIIMDNTPEGLRIQLVDQEGRSMFGENSAAPNERAKTLLLAIAGVINKLPNRISVYGHTSANSEGRSASGDDDLSYARARASTRLLEGSGVDPARVNQIAAKGSRDPLYVDDPTLAGNRRIAIVLLRERPVLPASGL